MTAHRALLTKRAVFAQSWPIMLANAAAPIVGLVDAFMVGRFIGTDSLAGIGLGTIIYSIVYWGFGFLRMSTAGLTAQSQGAGEETKVQAHILRAVPLGCLIGLLVWALQNTLLTGAFHIFTASPEIEQSASTYIRARAWGLPATLGSIALMGWYVGINRARLALGLQIILNLINIILSPLFVIGFGAGLYGVGLASALAEWGGFGAGIWLLWREVKRRGGWHAASFSKSTLFDKAALAKLGVANGNIFIRTMALTFGFNFFGNAAATEGETFLAGNHILSQMITISALVLDGFAHTAESVAGAAYGAKDRVKFNRAVKLTGGFSAGFALILSLLIWFGGPILIHAITHDPEVIKSAETYLPYCALVPLMGFGAYWLDGIFIGTTRTAAMRDAGIIALCLYIGLHYWLYPIWGATAIWIAFLFYYFIRAFSLGLYIPRLLKRF